jgi:hypothetical protein
MQIHDEHDVYLLEHRGEAGRDAVVEKIVNERSKARPPTHPPTRTHARKHARARSLELGPAGHPLVTQTRASLPSTAAAYEHAPAPN